MDDAKSMRRKIQLAILATAVGTLPACASNPLHAEPPPKEPPQARPSDTQNLRLSDLKDCLFSLNERPPRLHLTPAEVSELTGTEGTACSTISVAALERHLGRTLPGRKRKGSHFSYRIALDEVSSDKARAADTQAACIYDLHRKKNQGKGRPMLAEGRPILASRSTADPRWLEPLRPLLPADLEVRQALVESWLHDAQLEHSSIAEFSRLVGVLMSLSAPPQLIEDTLSAAQDELRHARLCFSLAAAYAGGVPQGPGDFPQELSQTDRRALALQTFRQGCVGEAVAALEAAHAARSCRDPVVQQVLEAIASDEERHATLAWRTLAWLLSSASDAERGGLLEAVQQLHGELRPAKDRAPALDESELSGWGVLDATAAVALEARAWQAIVTPSWTQLRDRMTGLDGLRPSVTGPALR